MTDVDAQMALVSEKVYRLRVDLDRHLEVTSHVLELDREQYVKREIFDNSLSHLTQNLDEAVNDFEKLKVQITTEHTNLRNEIERRFNAAEQGLVAMRASLGNTARVLVTAFVAPVIVAWLITVLQ